MCKNVCDICVTPSNSKTHDLTLYPFWVIQATKNMAELARTMRGLRAFCHVSTSYVNCDQPRGSHIEERVYPLLINGVPADPDAVLGRLAALSPAEADREVRFPAGTSGQTIVMLSCSFADKK
jgi:hypothetical protein